MSNIPSPFNLQLDDYHSRGQWLLNLTGQPSVSWFTQDSFSVVLNAESRKIGDFDEQRDWSGGRGGERFSDDPNKYKDAREAFSAIPGHLFPSLQWKISTGYRDAEQALPGSVSWRGLFGTTQSISRTFTASASSNRDKVWLWLRRVGSPGTLTVELRTDDTGSPSSTVLKSATVTTTDITDIVSLFQVFDWTGVQAVTSATVYHIVACGADTDNDKNHWEVGVDTGGTSSKYSASGAADAGSWTTAAFSMYYRIVDADTSRRWWFFTFAGNFYKVSNEATAALYVWNETDDDWDVIAAGTHGLGQVTGRPIAVNGFCYFPQGDSVAIRVWDGTNWDAQTIASGQGCATGLAVGYSNADNSTQIWRYNNALVSGGTTTGLKCTVSRANQVAAYNTDLAFRESRKIGDSGTPITGILAKDNALYVFKSNQVGIVDNDRYTELDYGIRNTPSSENGQASVNWNGLTFFNWLFSTSRIYSGTVDDVGQGFKNNSFPYGREGIDAAYSPYLAWLFVAKDAGASGTSSVMIFDGLYWHEFARAWAVGKRIRDVAIQVVSGARNRLWFDCGGDTCYIELPSNKGNPLDDTGVRYMHEAVVESCEIDMGSASKLPKYIESFTATTKNLNSQGIRVDVDYQLDDGIGLTGINNWFEAGAFYKSPEDTVKIREGNLNKFAYRLRLQTDNSATPPDIRGIVPNGFARSPARKIFTCEADVKNVQVNGKVQSAKATLNWMEEAAQSATKIHVKSKFWDIDDHDVILAPPNIYPIKADPITDKITFTMMSTD